MAVNKVPQGTVVSIKVQAGTNKAGAPTFKALRFSGVKSSAADGDLYAVASGMGELQSIHL